MLNVIICYIVVIFSNLAKMIKIEFHLHIFFIQCFVNLILYHCYYCYYYNVFSCFLLLLLLLIWCAIMLLLFIHHYYHFHIISFVYYFKVLFESMLLWMRNLYCVYDVFLFVFVLYDVRLRIKSDCLPFILLLLLLLDFSAWFH